MAAWVLGGGSVRDGLGLSIRLKQDLDCHGDKKMKLGEWIISTFLVLVGCIFIVYPMKIWNVFKISFDFGGMKHMANVYTRLERTWIPNLIVGCFGIMLVALGCIFLGLEIHGR